MPIIQLTEMPQFSVQPMAIETSEFQEVVSKNGVKPGMSTADGLSPIAVVYTDGKIRSYEPNQYSVMKIVDIHIPIFKEQSMTGGKRASRKSRKGKGKGKKSN
jgi:hypothetical protein